MLVVICIVLAICFFLLFAMWPGRGRDERMKEYSLQMVAHRGFHDDNKTVPENSMAAYRLAVEKGFGIELDVRLTRDGKLICMHDRNLKRAAGVDKNADELDWQEMKDLRLFGSEERIPLFEEVLRMVGGRVPIVMEIKAESSDMAGKTSEAAALMLDSYQGPVCMESFHPAAVSWFKKNRPETLRGQLSERFKGYSFPRGIGAFLLSCCVFDFLTKPDFIAYNVQHRNLVRFRILRGLYHAECAAWVVRSKEELLSAAGSFDIFIFEGFDPSSS